MKLGENYKLNCGHEGKIIWISENQETIAVKAPRAAGSCCNTNLQGRTWNPTIFLIDASNKPLNGHTKTSHLTTLVRRFLTALHDMKSWNQLDNLKGEKQLRRHISNIIEYTFHFHKQQITEQEVEKLIHLLEEGET